MNAMTLLRAMSALDPQDLEHALCAGKAQAADSAVRLTEPKPGMHTVLPAEAAPPENRWLRISGIAAVAACFVTAVSVLLYVHNRDDVLMVAPSVSGQFAEITETAAEQTVPVTYVSSESAAARQTTQRSEAAAMTATTANTAETRETQPPQDTAVSQQTVQDPPAESVTAGTTALPVMTFTVTQTAPPVQTEAPATPAYASEIPVLAAMGDGAGVLGSSPDLQIITDAAAIRAYLSGTAPVVTVGNGGKSAGTVDAIMQHPELIRIRWQPESSVWDSYGIESAVLDGNGVLHLTVGMYNSGNPQPEPEWIYEASLLCEAGTMPPVQGLDLNVHYYEDTAGITQWLAYTASLDEDVYVQYRP